MARLADMMASGEVQPPRWLVIDAKEIAGWRETIAATLDKCQVVVADEVLEAFFATEDPSEWEVGSDFANLAPLAPLCWLEGRRPARVPAVQSGGEDWARLPASWGWLFEAHDVSHLAGQERKVSPQELADVRRSFDAYWPLLGGEIDAAIAAHGEGAREHLRPSLRHYFDIRQELTDVDAGKPILHPSQQKWEVRGTLFQEGEGHSAVGPLARLDLLLDADGRPIDYTVGPIFSLGAPAQAPSDLTELGLLLAKPMLLAIALSHWRATTAERREPPQRLARAFERRHGRKPLAYYDLRVGPALAQVRAASEDQLRVALAALPRESVELPAGQSALGNWPETEA